MQGYIDKLISARGEERLQIARQMAKRGREAISAVDRLLTSRDHHLRLAATMVLSNIQNPQVIPALAHALKDADSTVRLQAAAGLGEHKRPGAREALWYAFPDKTPGVSIAILRSMEKIMTTDMEDALRVMDTRQLSPRVRTEIEQLLVRRAKSKDKTADSPDIQPAGKRELQSPLHTAPWLRIMPGGPCTGTTLVGTEDIAAAMLRWKFDGVDISGTEPGQVFFEADRDTLAHLVEARALESVWVTLPRAAGTELSDDTALFDILYAFSHAKGLQSLITSGEISGSTERNFGRALGLRSARPPGNPRTLRLQVTHDEVLAEFISPTDFPMLKATAEGAATSRALAACLCALAVNGPRDVFLDPFCGDGAVVVERALLGALQQAIAADAEENLMRARRTWHVMAPLSAQPGESIRFTGWRDTKLPVGDRSVDAIASILTANRLDNLETWHFHEIARVLRPGRRAAFLVPVAERLQPLANAVGLSVQQSIPVGNPQVGELVVLVKPE